MRLPALLTAALAVVALSACGSSSSGSGNASSLLKQTFSGSHAVNSGNLTFSLSISPAGSSTLKGPITLSFGGPFQSLGKGKLPESNFNVSISALGHTGTLGILSTGTNGYVSMQGTSYQLPAATFQKLESSFAQLASSPGGGSGGSGTGSGALGKLGINPLRWLVNPSIAGSDTVAGASTTHVRAAVNVSALLADLNTFLGKASSLGVSGASSIPHGISTATQSRIASEIRSPSFDVWTGSGDKTVRKLMVGLTLPVTGQISSLLGGLSSAAITLTMQYANLNQPQTIVAPTNLAPYSQFTAKLQSILQAISSALGTALPGTSAGGASTGTGTSTTGSSSTGSSTTGSSTTGSSSTGSGSAASTTKYGQCILAAGGDVGKMQKCASLVGK
jgi:hypothetical protein